MSLEHFLSTSSCLKQGFGKQCALVNSWLNFLSNIWSAPILLFTWLSTLGIAQSSKLGLMNCSVFIRNLCLELKSTHSFPYHFDTEAQQHLHSRSLTSFPLQQPLLPVGHTSFQSSRQRLRDSFPHDSHEGPGIKNRLYLCTSAFPTSINTSKGCQKMKNI